LSITSISSCHKDGGKNPVSFVLNWLIVATLRFCPLNRTSFIVAIGME
jgi:hypothetical protein